MQFYEAVCVLDSMITGNVQSVIENVTKKFLRECRSETKRLAALNRKLAKLARKIARRCGFTHFRELPELKCRNRGRLSRDGGCVCAPGFCGLTCEVDVRNHARFVPTSEELDAVKAADDSIAPQSSAPVAMTASVVAIAIAVINMMMI
jgi:hypothetical protein